MKSVTYVGPHGGGVDLMLPSGGSLTVKPGESVQVSDDLADRLVEQASNWKPDGWQLPAAEASQDAAVAPETPTPTPTPAAAPPPAAAAAPHPSAAAEGDSVAEEVTP